MANKVKKAALNKLAWREIPRSKTRFLSILAIIFLGVAFFVGISAAGPDMLETASRYFIKQKLSDIRAVSTIGFDSEDVKQLEKVKGVASVAPSYNMDVNLINKNQVVQIQTENSKGNQYVVTKGHLPEKNDEIALDTAALRNHHYNLGDTFEIQTDEATAKNFKIKKFKVVGIVNSPKFIETFPRGNTNVGKGSVDYFAVVQESAIKSEYYTELNVRLKKDVNEEETYSSAYSALVRKEKEEVKTVLSNSGEKRVETLKDEAQEKLDPEKEKLAEAQKKLDEAKQQAEQLQGIPMMAEQYQATMATLSEEQQKIDEGQQEINAQQKKIDAIKKPKLYLFVRTDNPGYSEYKENAKRLSSIATVFPVFFFLIAALICLTTMTRMVDESRMELGTFKALGYSNFDITKKFLLYAISASLVGTTLGIIVGYNLFPKIIFNAYGSLYNINNFHVGYYFNYSIASYIVALICTVGATLLVLRVDLLSTPAKLMQPKVPKSGKRNLLERIPLIWSHLSFLRKVSIRNLLRYKQRMVMIILGVAGCMAMIVTGFGLRDSIADIVSLQFNDIYHYQAVVTYNKKNVDTEKIVAETDGLEKSLLVSSSSVKTVDSKLPSQSISLYVPKTTKDLGDFITFKNRKSGKTLKLTDEGVIISEKLATLFKIKKGNYLTIKDKDNIERKLKVIGVAENYTGHFMYATPSYFQKHFKSEPKYNSEFLVFDKLDTKKEDKIAENLMKNKDIANVTFLAKLSSSLNDSLNSLNIVMWVLIISAGLLAFIVLYNLTNINISERIRELSTIKVLGFYDREVTMYIYRENIILTALGIFVGCFLGKLLHTFVLKTAEVDNVMFSPTIHLISYVYGALITFAFSTIVMLIMHQKLKKVDMIEALKSNE
jgi:putative ABC transport system permease protein